MKAGNIELKGEMGEVFEPKQMCTHSALSQKAQNATSITCEAFS